jgi:hypothetical protein
MGEGLKKVCKQLGGLKVIGKDGKIVEYDKNGKPKKKKEKKRLETYESFVSKIYETGEPDINYKEPEMDKIVAALEDKGLEAYYKEFDKYQGVYLVIKDNKRSKKFWWTDTYSRGTWGDGFVSSELIDDENYASSGNAGDYWDLPDDYVFQDMMLIYKYRKNGKVETTRIDNPKKSDLPDITAKESEFTAKQEIMEFTLDGTDDVSIEYVVDSGNINQFLEFFKEPDKNEPSGKDLLKRYWDRSQKRI